MYVHLISFLSCVCVGGGVNPQNVDPNKLFLHLSYNMFNLKSMNSSAQEHAHHNQTTKFHVHEIK